MHLASNHGPWRRDHLPNLYMPFSQTTSALHQIGGTSALMHPMWPIVPARKRPGRIYQMAKSALVRHPQAPSSHSFPVTVDRAGWGNSWIAMCTSDPLFHPPFHPLFLPSPRHPRPSSPKTLDRPLHPNPSLWLVGRYKIND